MADLAPKLESYSRKYKHVRMIRRNGILELCVHTNGDSLKWGARVHEELGYCFADVADDPENKVVILTGDGPVFCTEIDSTGFDLSPAKLGALYHEGKRLLQNLLNIEVPVIGAVNGPAHIHAELLLLSNIVVTAENATFQDDAHFPRGAVPGDGVHVVWPALLGPTRGSYFLLTGEVIDAKKALELGVVNEVVPRAALMSRAWAIAEKIASRQPMLRRYARVLLTQEMKRLMLEHLSHGLAAESLAFLENAPG